MADFLPCDDVCGALEEHVRRFFHGQRVEAFTWSAGPVLSVNPHFRALRIAPAERRGLWQYVSVGGWAAAEGQGRGLEFVISTPAETPRAVELLAMVVYHRRTGRLGPDHTLPIGEPWLPGSACDHLLVSLPYPVIGAQPAFTTWPGRDTPTFTLPGVLRGGVFPGDPCPVRRGIVKTCGSACHAA